MPEVGDRAGSLAGGIRPLIAGPCGSGAVAWEHDLVNTNLSTAPAIAGGVLYLPTHDGRLLPLSEQTP